MIYIPRALTDAWLMEDIHVGDLTSRALDIGSRPGVMTFRHRQGGCISGIAPAVQMLAALQAQPDILQLDKFTPDEAMQVKL